MTSTSRQQQQIIVDDSIASVDATGLWVRRNGFQYSELWENTQSTEYFRNTVSWFDGDVIEPETLSLRVDFQGERLD